MKKLFWIFFSSVYLFASNAWHKENLYDKITMSYYIPYELWLQIPWDGDKKRVFHTLENKHKKEGYFQWYHPYLKKHIKVYKTNTPNTKLFTFYPKGVVQLFDEKGNVYLNDGVIFPAGFGWKTNKIYTFSQEIWIENKHLVRTIALKINDIIFDNENNLQSLSFDVFVNGTLKKSETIQPIKQ